MLGATNLTRRIGENFYAALSKPAAAPFAPALTEKEGRGGLIRLTQSYGALRCRGKEEAMARKTVDNVVAELDAIFRVFDGETDLKIGDITRQSLTATISGLRAKSAELEAVKAQVTTLVNSLDADLAAAVEIQTRGLSGIRAIFGPDSSQYELAGGTRKSERKKPTKKKTG